MSQGKIIIFSAPSGAGKTTIVRHLLDTNECLTFSISATTRSKRPLERNGIDYYFFSADEFKNKIATDSFIEYEEVYEGIFYGTLKEETERIWRSGKHIIVDVDVKGGLKLKSLFGKKALCVFVKAPNLEILEERLRARETESEEILNERIKKAEEEMAYESQFDMVIENNKLEIAFKEAQEIVKKFIGNKTNS